jgi:hypothetical protein
LLGKAVEVETVISIHGTAHDLIALLGSHPLARLANRDASAVDADGGPGGDVRRPATQ